MLQRPIRFYPDHLKAVWENKAVWLSTLSRSRLLKVVCLNSAFTYGMYTRIWMKTLHIFVFCNGQTDRQKWQTSSIHLNNTHQRMSQIKLRHDCQMRVFSCIYIHSDKYWNWNTHTRTHTHTHTHTHTLIHFELSLHKSTNVLCFCLFLFCVHVWERENVCVCVCLHTFLSL